MNVAAPRPLWPWPNLMEEGMTALDATYADRPAGSRAMRVTGWTLSGLLIAFMAFDTAIKLIDLPIVAETSQQLGWPASLDRLIGVTEFVSLALYIWPRTAVLGAILLTGLFGGAVAAHLRLFDPLFSHTLFGVYLGGLAWGGLWFRDERVRALLPWRR
jgi:hypothetical protein